MKDQGLPREWCCPQWAGSYYINQPPRQSPIDTPTGQSYLKVPSWMTLGCIKLTVKINRINLLLFIFYLLIYYLIAQSSLSILLLFRTCLSYLGSNNSNNSFSWTSFVQQFLVTMSQPPFSLPDFCLSMVT